MGQHYIKIGFITLKELSKLKRKRKAMAAKYRSSHPLVFLLKGVPKLCTKFTGEHTWRSAISIKLLSIFIEITRWQGCSPVNLQHNFRTPYPQNTLGGFLLKVVYHFVVAVNLVIVIIISFTLLNQLTFSISVVWCVWLWHMWRYDFIHMYGFSKMTLGNILAWLNLQSFS